MAQSAVPQQSRVFGGSAHPQLARWIADAVGVAYADVRVERFPDGETKTWVGAFPEGQAAIVVQPTPPPVNDHLVELLLSIEAVCGAGASKVIAVVPYLGYARQCRRNAPGEPLSARLVLQMIERAGAQAVVTLDLHDPSITRLVDIPVWNVSVEGLMADYIKALVGGEREPVIVSPDRGGAKRAETVGRQCGGLSLVLEKSREGPGGVAFAVMRESEVGSLQGRVGIIVDDMVTTGGTLVAAVQTLREEGAVVVGAVCTHGLLCAGALDRLEGVGLPRLAVSDSLPASLPSPLLDRFSIAPLLAQVIGAALEGDYGREV